MKDGRQRTLIMPGLHIQYPWSQLLLEGSKTIETRKYPLPEKYVNEPLAIIETSGRSKPKFKARVVGIITFSQSKEYKTFDDWRADRSRHKVAPNNEDFRFKDGEIKFGWIVKSVTKLITPCSPPTKRGIVFALGCRVPANDA